MNLNNKIYAEKAIVPITVILWFVAVSIVWHQTWVEPRDQFLYAVMDCMDTKQDHSRTGYSVCADTVRENGRH